MHVFIPATELITFRGIELGSGQRKNWKINCVSTFRWVVSLCPLHLPLFRWPKHIFRLANQPFLETGYWSLPYFFPSRDCLSVPRISSSLLGHTGCCDIREAKSPTCCHMCILHGCAWRPRKPVHLRGFHPFGDQCDAALNMFAIA